MNYDLMNNNKVFLMGEVVTEPEFSHEIYGEGFYIIHLSVNRLSEICDTIPLTISERLLEGNALSVGSVVAIKGQFRSYNKQTDEKSKLMLTVFVREVVPYEDNVNPNVIEISGYVCKQPIFRTTPFNREICDILLAVNRAYNKSDYLPCIAWGRNARYLKNVGVGEHVFVTGRIQSREYVKKIDDDKQEVRVAYEISIGKVTTGSLPMVFSEDDSNRWDAVSE